MFNFKCDFVSHDYQIIKMKFKGEKIRKNIIITHAQKTGRKKEDKLMNIYIIFSFEIF